MIIQSLTGSFVFVFGIIPNVFNLAFPEAYAIASKLRLGWLNKYFNWFVIIPLLFVPFSWLFLFCSLIFVRKVINISDEFGRLKINDVC